MTLLENSSWFSHIQMPEKLDYGSTNSRLPSSKHCQDRDLPGASIPPAVAQQEEDATGWRTISKGRGFGCDEGLCRSSPTGCKCWGGRPDCSPPARGNQGRACSPNTGLASLLAGGPALVCHHAVLKMAANVNSPPSPLPSPVLGRAADKLTDSEGNAWKKTHSRQKNETHMAGNNISFVR